MLSQSQSVRVMSWPWPVALNHQSRCKRWASEEMRMDCEPSCFLAYIMPSLVHTNFQARSAATALVLRNKLYVMLLRNSLTKIVPRCSIENVSLTVMEPLVHFLLITCLQMRAVLKHMKKYLVLTAAVACWKRAPGFFWATCRISSMSDVSSGILITCNTLLAIVNASSPSTIEKEKERESGGGREGGRDGGREREID